MGGYRFNGFSLQFTAVEVPIVVREAKCTLACAATPTVKPKLCERADKAMGLFVVADNLCSISTIKDCYFKGISGEDIDFVKSNLTRLCK